MIKIAICDDDVKLSGKLETMLNGECLARGIRPEIDVFYDGSPLARSIIKGDRYSIIFLDIEMKELDGITTARMIRTIDKDSLIIYVSNYDSYLKELFEVEPLCDHSIFKKECAADSFGIMGKRTWKRAPAFTSSLALFRISSLGTPVSISW